MKKDVLSVLLIGTLLTVALAPLSVLAATAPYQASPERNFTDITRNEDKFYNYDNKSESAAWDNVDWMVNAIYGEDAHWTKIRDMYPSWGGNEHMYLYDGSNWIWRANGGGKTLGWTTTAHVRAYGFTEFTDGLGRTSYRSYNDSWGYYLVATGHYDILEGSGDPDEIEFGYSEDADLEHANRAEDYGYSFQGDLIEYMKNWDWEDPWRTEHADQYGSGPHHVWQGNAKATYIDMS